MGALEGKNIILGITGGIAVYKSVSLLRLLTKAGAEVQVVATPAALQFVQPVTFASLSRRPVISEFFTANTGVWHSHVSLGEWADAMVIAPATACTIGKMAAGIADNMLVTTYLSARCPIFVAPAMDFDMMRHPSTCRNISSLAADGVHIIEPCVGELASGLNGRGRMAEPSDIQKAVESYFHTCGSMAGRKVLVTAGPTYERIDPVRFIGNFSTGKMGFALAREAAKRGARVTLVTGPTALECNSSGVDVVRVESAAQMLEACRMPFEQADVAIFSAAVADYAPAHVATSKIKREHDGIESIKLIKNPDIAATLGAARHDGQLLVGFALETDNAEVNAREKMVRKHLDMVVLNSLADKGAGFGTDTNKVTIITADRVTSFPLKSKDEVAADIMDSVIALSACSKIC